MTEELIDFHQSGFLDIIRTTIFCELIDYFVNIYQKNHFLFVDSKMNEAFNKIIEKANLFSKYHSSKFTTTGKQKEVKFKNDKISISTSFVEPVSHEVDYSFLDSKLKDFLSSYEDFKQMIFSRKRDGDIYL